MRCSCGSSFGNRRGTRAICSRCGSSKCTKIADYENSSDLSKAVSEANLPKELSNDISSRISKENKNLRSNKERANSRFLVSSMKNATDENGIITLQSLNAELQKINIKETSAELLVGQAEMEGILLRTSEETWTWL
tara:strand:- start:757 stop:1167 length:411 start_codon:yes stop_codon:yes gene_type:complete